MSAHDPLLRCRGLEVGFDKKPMLPPIDLEIRRRELWGVIGRNGAGKTTLFRTLVGLHPAVAGSIERAPRLGVAYVPQRHSLDPIMPARAIDLIAEGSESGLSFLRPLRSQGQKERVRRAIAETGTEALLPRRFRDLSEGEKQRVLLARALAGGPDFLVLDEPTSAMDAVAEREMMKLLARLKDALCIGVLLVTHHVGLVLSVADGVLFVDSDDRVAVAGSVGDVMSHPVFVEQYGAVLAPPLSGPASAPVERQRP
jgi:zinc transport system ATP-binding protein